MSKERLIFKGVSEIVGTESLGLLIMTDEAMLRQITIVCDKAMAVQIELRVKRLPTTQLMLPEVLCKAFMVSTAQRFDVYIDDIIDGQYHTLLNDNFTLDSLQIRASDAVLLSLVSEVPIYIDSQLMKRQSVPYNKYARGVSLPVNTISDEMLQAALDKAIADENYELASHLRDEQKRRHNSADDKLDNN